MERIEATDAPLPDPPSVVGDPSTSMPLGYRYAVTRYADVILREAFPDRFQELVRVLEGFRIDAEELVAGGGNRGPHTARFDSGLADLGWGKRNVSISKLIDDRLMHATRSHEIDMFGRGSERGDYPGIAVEMEWNNKDPFFDRDLLNFQALHREGALAVGVIVTRGPSLQELLRAANPKFGQSTTHWDKLVPRVSLGGGGECPLLLIGIEPGRVSHAELLAPQPR